MRNIDYNHGGGKARKGGLDVRPGNGFNQIAYQNGYIKEKYDRINLTVPKGRKEEIRKKAAAGGKSVNEYINSLIDNDMD